MDRKEYYKKRYQENKEKLKLQTKEYRDNNKEKIKENKKIYYQSKICKKSYRISNWKQRGVIHNDFNELYDYFINCKNCDNCNCCLDLCNKSKKCLDHCHTTGEFRNILCHSCNVKRG